MIATDFQENEAPKEEIEKEEAAEDKDGQNNSEPENAGKAEAPHEDKKRSGQGEYIVPSFFEQNLE